MLITTIHDFPFSIITCPIGKQTLRDHLGKITGSIWCLLAMGFHLLESLCCLALGHHTWNMMLEYYLYYPHNHLYIYIHIRYVCDMISCSTLNFPEKMAPEQLEPQRTTPSQSSKSSKTRGTNAEFKALDHDEISIGNHLEDHASGCKWLANNHG